MDTGTVLSIIEMIDKRYQADNSRYQIDIENRVYFRGKLETLDELRNHLQDFIENEVNKAENQTGE